MTISDFVSEVTVSLSNGVSGSNTSLSVSLSNIDFCSQNSGVSANNIANINSENAFKIKFR